MDGLNKVLSDLRPVSIITWDPNFPKVKIMDSFSGPKWFEPDYDHLGPSISPGLGLK